MIGLVFLAVVAALTWSSLAPDMDVRSRLGLVLLAIAAAIVAWFSRPVALFVLERAIARIRHHWYYRWLFRRQRLSMEKAERQAEKIMREARLKRPWLVGMYGMPTATVDFLFAQSAALAGLYATIVSNKDGVTQYAAAQPASLTGQFTISPKPPGGTYKLYTGNAAGVLTTLVDPDFDVDGWDDAGNWHQSTGATILDNQPVFKAVAYNAVAGDYVMCNANAAGFVVTLPVAAKGVFVLVKKTDVSNNIVTVTPAAGLINGAANYLIQRGNQAVMFLTDGANWYTTHEGVLDNTGHAILPNGVSIGGNGDPFISATLPKYGIDFTGVTDSSTGVTQHLADCAAVSAIAKYPPNSTIKCTNVNSPAQSTGFLIIEGAGRGSTTFQGFGNQDHTLNLRMPGEVRDCKVDGGGAMTNGSVLYMTTSTGIPISSMACRRCDVGNSGVNGFWQIAIWDGGQTYAINRAYMEDVFLYGPNKSSLDGSTISFVNQAFMKNVTTDGVSRPNWFFCHHLEIDGYRGVNSNAASASVMFDTGIDDLNVNNMYIDNAGGTGVQLNCSSARFTNTRIENVGNSIICAFSNTGAPVRLALHQCTLLGTLSLESPVESIEIVGGTYGAANTFGTNGIITDFCLANTTHTLIRITDAILAKTLAFFAFNNPINVTEFVLTNNTFLNPGRNLGDVALVNTSTTITSPSALFTTQDVGRSVRDAANIGLGLIPGGTTITAIISLTQATMSAAATGSTTAGNPDQVALGSLAVAASGSGANAGTTNANTVLGVKSKIRGNGLYNPVGVEVVAVPGTGVAVAAVAWDRTYYVTSAGGGATTMTIQNGPAVVVPVNTCVAVRVPAGKTVTPTFAAAPTWVVEGE